ncbi:MAG: acyltransferase family protein, partial [Pseudomonadota bacterium]
IRRLLPALIAMMAVSSVAASVILMPSALEQYGRHLVAALLSISNIAFWLDSGYFAADAETFPLLHTWSLAVEEQFYMVFPVLLYGLYRYARRAVVPAVWGLTACSFALAVWWVESHPSAAFYLAPARMWELTLGSLLALGAIAAPRADCHRYLAGWVGLAMIGGSFVWLGHGTPFPGFGALAPCLGTALIIWAGQGGGAASTGLQRLLSHHSMVWIGLLSYSLYLWHWPMIVFAEHASVAPLSTGFKLALIPAMGLVAYLSWRFVEQPFRRGDRIWPQRRQRWVYAGAAAAVLGSFGLSANALEGYPQRLSHTAKSLAAYEAASSPDRARCHAKVRGQDRYRGACRFGPRGGERVIVFSDSHGTELSYAFRLHAKAHGLRVTQVTGSACPPAVAYFPDMRAQCAGHTDLMLKAITREKPATVIVQANYELWNSMAKSEQFWTGYEQTLATLTEAGHRVVVLGPIPTDPNGSLPLTLAQQVQLGRDPAAYQFPVDAAIRDEIKPRLEAILRRQTVEYIPLMPALCGGDVTCRGMSGDTVAFFDSNHLSVPMAEQLLTETILPQIFPQALAAAETSGE